MGTSVRKNMFPPSLTANLQNVLISRRGSEKEEDDQSEKNKELGGSSEANEAKPQLDCPKPIILVTNGDGISSSGLVCLVEALAREGQYSIHVCAPEFDKSASGHSITIQETITANSVEINGAVAYEISGTPADCVSLSLSGSLFPWSKPTLVISGINKGASCGYNSFHSGVVAGAREALVSGIPSLSISLNWKKQEIHEKDFKDAATVCLPLIKAAIRDAEKGIFPEGCSLMIEVPPNPLMNKGFKITKLSSWRLTPCWRAVSANRHPSAGNFMSNQQSLGIQLAQLSRDASAAGAARRIQIQKKNIEIESVGAAGKSDFRSSAKKHFRLELLEKEMEDLGQDFDVGALENGYVAITPLSLFCDTESEVRKAATTWLQLNVLTPEE